MLNRTNAPVAQNYMWGPLWDAATQWNAHAVESANALSAEWQSFIDRRTHENLAFAEEVGRSRTPTEFWSAYAKYWQNAAEDMRVQSMAIDKRMREITGKAAATMQPTGWSE